ncbi:MAG: glutathione S-transferase family protein [Burkholderiales bacterium]|nr:glutathione S-transferase family protein [Burkholderiales bacterium]
MIYLHYSPSTASMAPHILLEELAVPYELVLINKEEGELDSPAYRKLNPNGLIPVLRDDDLVLYETAAICLHLVDRFPAAGLIPSVGTAARGECYKWLSWLSATLQSALIVYFYPNRWADTPDAVVQIKAHAEARVLKLLEQLDAQLASGRDWVLGDRYSVVDIYAMMLCRWTRNFPHRKARDFAHLAPWLERVLARPAVQRVFAREEIGQPWV